VYSACVDIDECDTIANVCPANSTCVNAIPGYFCSCDRGFAHRGSDSTLCVGIVNYFTFLCIKQSTVLLWLVHTADATWQDSFVWSPNVFTLATRQFFLVSTQFRWVPVGGVNTIIRDATELSCLVELAVWTQLQTRQDSFVCGLQLCSHRQLNKTRQFCLVRVVGVNKPLRTQCQLSNYCRGCMTFSPIQTGLFGYCMWSWFMDVVRQPTYTFPPRPLAGGPYISDVARNFHVGL